MKTDISIKRVTSFDDLVDVMIKEEENIIYGAGGMAFLLMRHLYYNELYRKVLCISVGDELENPTNIYDVPVVAIDYLSHFYKTACYYLALKESNQESIKDLLVEKGCKRIICISDSVFVEIEKSFDHISTNTIIDKGIRLNKYQVERSKSEILFHNEVVSTNTRAFYDYKEINAGKEIVVLATGPTASKYRIIDNALHLGVNTTPMLDIPLDYYFAHDVRAFKNIPIEKIISRCNGEKFIGHITNRSFYRLEYLRCAIDISHINRTDVHEYYVNTPCMNEELVKDICVNSLTDYFSIVFAALQFALFTKPSRIYLVGCDVSGKLEHFNNSSSIKVPHSKYFKLGFGILKRFVKENYPEVEIVSVNPVGLKGLFEDYYQEV